jgi:hypothetical protein
MSQQAIDLAFVEYLRDAATARELYKVLSKYLAERKGLEIYQNRLGFYGVGRTNGLDNGVFQSASYTACVEWCLDQPDVKAE